MQSRLCRALAPDGPAEAAALGELQVAWTGADRASAGEVTCVIEGRPRTAAVAAAAELDPAGAPAPLLAAAYRRIGERLLELLAGDFAVLIWDAERRAGIVARDRAGARPLFTATRPGATLFASEVRNLLPLLESRPAPDPVAVRRWLARVPSTDPRTLFEGIRRVPGGHVLRVRDRHSEVEPFWRPRYSPPRDIAPDAAAGELHAALGAATERALAGARCPGVMLSGGLDSAGVAAAAAASRPAPRAYSGVFPDRPRVDESDRIRRVREALGLPGVELPLGGGSAIEAAAQFIRAWELPPAAPNGFVWTPLMRRAAADGVDVMLDGEGGDELFGCARYLVADRLRSGGPAAGLRIARRLPGMGARPRARWLARALLTYGVRGALPPALHEPLRSARGRSGGPAWLAEPLDHDERWSWKRLDGPRWWAQLAHMLTADSLGAVDHHRRSGVLDGVELRHPLYDPELVDLVLSLPPELGFDPVLDRPLARRALARDLPADFLATVDKPFFGELLGGALARDPDRHAVRELLARPHPGLARHLRAGALASGGEPAGGDGAPSPLGAPALWRVAVLELWLRHGGGSD